jgi:hypothetical protein
MPKRPYGDVTRALAGSRPMMAGQRKEATNMSTEPREQTTEQSISPNGIFWNTQHRYNYWAVDAHRTTQPHSLLGDSPFRGKRSDAEKVAGALNDAYATGYKQALADLESLTADDLDARARRLGWDSNAEMTHQAHNAPAFGCAYCAASKPYVVQVRRNGRVLASFQSERGNPVAEAFGFIHANTPYSVEHAIRHAGYSIYAVYASGEEQNIGGTSLS